MSLNSDIAICFVLENEGKFSNNKRDHGGVTAFGITAKYLMDKKMWRYDLDGDGVISESDMRHFTRDNAFTVYENWWDEDNFNGIWNVDISKRLFDFAIHCGQYRAVKIAQSTINWLFEHKELEEDGILGKKTVDVINGLDQQAREKFMDMFKTARLNYYDYLVSKDHTQEKFLGGWRKRANR